MTPRNHPGKVSGKHILVQAICCWLVISGVCSGALASSAKPAKRILILFSYQSVTPGFLEWDEGIHSVLQGTARKPQALLASRLANKTLEEVEREHILKVLQETGGRVSGSRGAAAILGLNPSTLRAPLRKLEIIPLK